MKRRAALVVAGVVAAVIVGWGVRRSVAPGTRSARGGSDASGAGQGDADGVRARVTDSAARRVRAQIVDDLGEPLDGGHVSLRCLFEDEVTAIAGNTWKLDDEGAFEGPGCLGIVCVDLHHPTAVPAEPWVLEPGEPAVLKATTLPRLHGTVVDSRNRPIAAARVSVRAPTDGDAEAMVPTIGTTTTTDVDGVFSFALVQRAPCDPCTEADRGCDDAPLLLHDRVLVGVHAPRFAPTRVEVEIEGSDVEAPAIRMAPPADVLSGTLVDAAGDAYPRAKIIARASSDPSEQHQAEVGQEGFAFESLGTGPYDLRALQDGVELATAKGVRPGDDVELVGSHVARGPDIELEITESGIPVAGVTVDGGPFRGAKTDTDGRVRADTAMPGPCTLSLRPPGADLQRHDLTIPPKAPRSDPAATPAPERAGRVQLRVELSARGGA
jgi:hypothetical protein